MLRRQKSETVTAEPEAPLKPSGKGRPTPTRRDAEAESRRRARAAVDTKQAKKQQRDKRSQQARKVRQGMRDGDERYLMKRDQGPVKRFVRNFVDSRLSIAEFLLPLLLLALVLQGTGQPSLVGFGASLVTVTSLIALLDTTWVVFRLKRAVRAEFPDESGKGVTLYAVMRVIQLRVLRMPKPQVKVGGAPKQPK